MIRLDSATKADLVSALEMALDHLDEYQPIHHERQTMVLQRLLDDVKRDHCNVLLEFVG